GYISVGVFRNLINILPVANISTNSDTIICEGGGVTLNANTDSGLTYQWRRNGIAIQGATSSSYTATSTGSYDVVVYSSSGCPNASRIINMLVKPKPKVGFTINNPSQCLTGNNFLFNDTSSFSVGTFTRKWNLGNGGADTTSIINPSRTYSIPNFYTVKLFIAGSNGCNDSVTKTVGVGISPVAGFAVNNTMQCANKIFSFVDTSKVSSGPLASLWIFGEGNTDTSTSINPNKLYSTDGTFTVKLISSNYGCKDSVSKTITTIPKPNVGFTINDTSQCINGNHFIFNDTSTIKIGTLVRLWNFGTGFNDTSTLKIPNKNYSSVNSYSIKIVETGSNG
ncbi:MAG: PKD domain-containing protein, partial [Bacteroidia bacterium]